MRNVFVVAIAAFVLTAAVAHAADPVAKCESRKFKAWGKLRACENKQRAAGRLGHTVDFTSCQIKLDDVLAKAGSGCRYVDNVDGTVTDLNTGLMWQKSDDLGGLTDKDYYGEVNPVSGEAAPNGPVYTVFLAALNDCQMPQDGIGIVVTGGFAGHCDWRLPQIDELAGIVDCSFGDPCIDQAVFGPVNPSSTYWSATSDADGPHGAWAVDMSNGTLGSYAKDSTIEARAVRVGL